MIWGMCSTISFKESKLQGQFEHQIDPRLRALLLDLARWAYETCRVQIVVTSLVRTKQENDAIGGNPLSAHLDGRAADLRSRLFSGTELDEMKTYLERAWGTDFLYVKITPHGTAPHVHININKAFKRKDVS